MNLFLDIYIWRKVVCLFVCLSGWYLQNGDVWRSVVCAIGKFLMCMVLKLRHLELCSKSCWLSNHFLAENLIKSILKTRWEFFFTSSGRWHGRDPPALIPWSYYIYWFSTLYPSTILVLYKAGPKTSPWRVHLTTMTDRFQ
jgi:hypothetical protein